MAADPGQVEPGTQKPIEIFFVVSKTEEDPDVGEYTPDRLADLFRGTEQRSRTPISDEYAIFTDRTSADEYAKRVKLVNKAKKLVDGIATDDLEQIVDAMESPERLIESINHYCE